MRDNTSPKLRKGGISPTPPIPAGRPYGRRGQEIRRRAGGLTQDPPDRIWRYALNGSHLWLGRSAALLLLGVPLCGSAPLRPGSLCFYCLLPFCMPPVPVS